MLLYNQQMNGEELPKFDEPMEKYVKIFHFMLKVKFLVSYSLTISILLELASVLQSRPIAATIFNAIESFQNLACAIEA